MEFNDPRATAFSDPRSSIFNDPRAEPEPPLDVGKLAAKQEAYDAANPLLTRLGQRFKRGLKDTQAGAHAKDAAEYAEALAYLQNPETAPFGGLFIPNRTPEEKQAAVRRATEGLAENVTSYSRLRKESAAIPRAPVVAASEGKSTQEALQALAVDPVAAVSELGLSSAVPSIMGAVSGTIGGLLSGKRGAGAGAFVGSAGVDYAAELSGALSRAGVDATDAVAVKAALQNPKLLAQMKKDAALHAGVVGLFDAISFGIAGKTLAPEALKKLTREVVNVPAQAVVQGALGGVGEVGGSLAAGRTPEPSDVIAEVVGEAFTAPADIIAAGAAGLRKEPTTSGQADLSPEELRQAFLRLNTPVSEEALKAVFPSESPPPSPSPPPPGPAEGVGPPLTYGELFARRQREGADTPDIQTQFPDGAKTEETLGPITDAADLAAQLHPDVPAQTEFDETLGEEPAAFRGVTSSEASPELQAWKEKQLEETRAIIAEYEARKAKAEEAGRTHAVQLPLEEAPVATPEQLAAAEATFKSRGKSAPLSSTSFTPEVPIEEAPPSSDETVVAPKTPAEKPLSKAAAAILALRRPKLTPETPTETVLSRLVEELKVGPTLAKIAEITDLINDVKQGLRKDEAITYLNRTPEDKAARAARPPDDALFVVGPKKLGVGMAIPEIERLVALFTSGWKNKPKIFVVASNAQFPEIAVKALQGSGNSARAQGVTLRKAGEVYLSAENLHSPQDVLVTLLHEAFGHYGLYQLLGADLIPLLQQVYASMSQMERENIAAQTGLSLTDKMGQLAIAEEHLSDLAATTPEISFVKRLVLIIRNWLRKKGLQLSLSDTDVLALIVDARNAVKEGERSKMIRGELPLSSNKSQTNTPVFKKWFGTSKVVDAEGRPLVVYHGTPHGRFEAFSYEARGTGADQHGLGDYGKGFYFTVDRGTAGGYAKGKTGDKPYVYSVFLRMERPLDLRRYAPLREKSSMTDAEYEFAENFLGIVGDNWQDTDTAVLLKEAGYDGVISSDGKEYVVLEPEQIRLTDSFNTPAGSDVSFSLSPKEGPLRVAKGIGMSKKRQDELNVALDSYIRGAKWGLALTQIALRNPHLPPVQNYTQLVREWWNIRSKWMLRADETLKAWGHLSKEQEVRFSKLLFDATKLSDKQARRLTQPELIAILQKHRFTSAMLELYLRIDGDMQAAIAKVEELLINEARRNFRDSPTVMAREIADIQKDFADIKNRNYFPYARFGKYSVTVKARARTQRDGKIYQIGDILSFETFSTEVEQKAAFAALLKTEGKAHGVSAGLVTPAEQSLQGLPPQLVARMITALGLSPEQIANLQALRNELSPSQSFRKRLLKRKGVAGHSLDARRGYANYFMNFSAHISRMEKEPLMRQAILDLGELIRDAKAHNQNTTKREKIQQHLVDHLKYIMSSEAEWANLRAVGALWYLGFSPKAAVVNLTQVPLVSLPHLAAKYGDIRAAYHLAKAAKDISFGWKNPDLFTPAEKALLAQGAQDGFIDESLATDVGGVADGNVLSRLLPGSIPGISPAARALGIPEGKAAELGEDGQYYLRQGTVYAMWMFQAAEKYNRRVTVLAAYRLAEQMARVDAQLGYDPVAYQEARSSVEVTQGEYAKWDRPRFLRGRKSVLLLFFSYIQRMMFFAFGGDKGWWRYWIMMFTAGGLMGLPLAQNVMDLVDFVTTKFLNKGDKKFDSALELRKLAGEISDNPDLIMHGLARETFGIPAFFSLLGVAVPTVDMSASISMGRVIPGTELLRPTGGTEQDKLMQLTSDAAGAGYSIPLNFLKAVMDDQPDWRKRWEKTFPTFVKNLTKGADYMTEGKETTRHMADLTPGDRITRAEAVAQMLGFTPTQITRAKEEDWAKKQTGRFYLTRQQMLLQDLNYARDGESPEAIADVQKAIGRFNNSVPDARLKITHEMRRNSREAWKAAKRAEARDRPAQKKLRHLYEDISETYNPAEDEEAGN